MFTFASRFFIIVCLLLIGFQPILPQQAELVSENSQDSQEADSSDQELVENESEDSAGTEDKSESVENKANAEKEKADQKYRAYTRKIVEQVNEMYRWTPEDPSFLYETRYVPDNQQAEEFLSPELEKVVIKERIQEEKDFRNNLEKIKIKLPGLTQTFIIVGIIIVILLYRSRVKQYHPPRR